MIRGSFGAASSIQIISAAYTEVVHFRSNLFPVPSGTCGEKFVAMLAGLFQCFSDSAVGEVTALKAAMLFTQLLLACGMLAAQTTDMGFWRY